MKRITLVLATLLLSCSNGEKEYLITAENYTNNLLKGQLEKAKEFMTESTAKLIEQSFKFKKQKIYPNFEFKVIKDSISKNEAWIKFTDKNNSKRTDKIYLIKVNEKWLVHIDNTKLKSFR